LRGLSDVRYSTLYGLKPDIASGPLCADFVVKVGCTRSIPVSHAAEGDRLWCAGFDALYATLTLLKALSRIWRRPGDQ
jgi:hypothetical protein